MPMDSFKPDFELVKMDAEIGSYQEDYDPEPLRPELASALPAAAREAEGETTAA